MLFRSVCRESCGDRKVSDRASDSASTSLGVVCKDGIILGTEKIVVNKMMLSGTDKRSYSIAPHVGCVVNGIVPDGRALMNKGREEAAQYKQMFGVNIPGQAIADRLALKAQMNTVYAQYRPFGSSMMLCCHDNMLGPSLWMIEPSGTCYQYYGCSSGRGRQMCRNEIEKTNFRELTVQQALPKVAKVLLPVWLLGCAYVSNVAWSPSPLSTTNYPVWSTPNARHESLRKALSLIPADASVTASYQLLPHLSHRREVYDWPNPFWAAVWGNDDCAHLPDPTTVDYVVLDLTQVGENNQALFDAMTVALKTLDRHFVVQPRHHDLAGARLLRFMHGDVIAVVDAGVAHAHAAHLQQIIGARFEHRRIDAHMRIDVLFAHDRAAGGDAPNQRQFVLITGGVTIGFLDADAARGQRCRLAHGVLDECRLHRPVGRRTRAGLKARDRGHMDDRAALREQRDRRVRSTNARHEIHVEAQIGRAHV